jgi:hypothetical protein
MVGCENPARTGRSSCDSARCGDPLSTPKIDAENRPRENARLPNPVSRMRIVVGGQLWKPIGYRIELDNLPKNQACNSSARRVTVRRRFTHCIINLYRERVINLQRMPDVLLQWEKPTFPDLERRNAWTMFNAITHALNGRVMDKPDATPKLHQIIDGVCSEIGHA